MSLRTELVDVTPGPHVVSIAARSVLVVDDAAGRVPEATTAALMAAAASGRVGEVHDALALHRHAFPGIAIVVIDRVGVSVFVAGTFGAVIETPGSRQVITALDGDVDRVPVASTATTVTLGPASTSPDADGLAPSSSATLRAGSARVDVTAVGRPAPLAAPQQQRATGSQVEAGAGAAAGPLAGVSGAGAVVGGAGVSGGGAVVGGAAGFDASVVDDAGQGAAALAAPAEVLVRGVRCPEGHHNHPDAVYCATCGRRLGINHTVVVGGELGPRPALGVLLLDDGATHSIDRNLIIGRDPREHPDVVAGAAAGIVVDDPDLNLSRRHFAITLDEWQVSAVDLNSSNGTLIRRRGRSDWEPLSTMTPVVLGAGDELLAGTRVFVVQLHHIQ